MAKRKICPRSQKSEKQNIKNYFPVSLFPNCGKIFERLTFNRIFSLFICNNPILRNQPGFKPGDS